MKLHGLNECASDRVAVIHETIERARPAILVNAICWDHKGFFFFFLEREGEGRERETRGSALGYAG